MQLVALFYLAQQSDALSLPVILLKLYEAAVRCLPREPPRNQLRTSRTYAGEALPSVAAI